MSSSSPNSSSRAVVKRKKSSLSEARITVLGDRDVGKSAIVVRFLTRRYLVEYEHGIDNRYSQELLVDNEPVVFDILDTSSNLSQTAANFDTNHFSSCDILLLVYSITDRQSFSFVRNLLRHLAQLKNGLSLSSHPPPLVAICGNKADLVHLRQVSSEEGEILCTEYSELGTTTFLGEVSAADQMLSNLFVDLYKCFKRNRHQHKSASLLDRMVIGIKGSSGNGF